MGRGGYLGGHTIIGPSSTSWFSKNKPRRPKRTTQHQNLITKKGRKNVEEKLREVLNQLAESDKKRQEKVARIQAQRLEAESTREKKRRRRLEAMGSKRQKQCAPKFHNNVQVYKKVGCRLKPVRVGISNALQDIDSKQTT